MRKITLYSAVSMNGMIAGAGGEIDWLDKINHEKGEDYGYADFYKGIDTTLMGNKTYQQVLGFGGDFPYKGKKNFVFTRNAKLTEDEHVQYVSDNIIDFVKALKEEEGENIWLVGGGQLNTLFMEAGLIDEIHVHIMPIVIPDGIQLFPGNSLEQQFNLISTRSFSSGVIECIYNLGD